MPRMKKTGCGQVKEPSVAYRRTGRTRRPRGIKSTLVRSRLDPRPVPVVVAAKALPGFRLHLSFDDGVSGELDMASRLFGPVFEPLKDERYFAQVRVNHELGAVVWPNGADFAPDVLHDRLIKSRPRPVGGS
jgi:hypothetical protein